MTNRQMRRVGSTAGAMTGIAAGIMLAAQPVLVTLGVSPAAAAGISDLLLLGSFIAFILAGIIVRHRTGSVDIAARAGLAAGAWAGLLSAVANLGLYTLAPGTYAAVSGQVSMATAGWGAVLLISLVSLAVEAGVGTGLAAAGALARHPLARRADQR